MQAERRLSTIMVADIAGYSALMEREESRTFARLQALLQQIVIPKIAEFGGRIIKTTGDGFLAEFSSPTAALACGITIQRMNFAQESIRDEAERFHVRVGINLGDIIVDGDDVSGDGVNIAARLEPLAPLDGICVSGAVRDQVREDLGVVLEDLGEQRVKNISRPIRAYRINLVSPSPSTPKLPQPAKSSRTPWVWFLVSGTLGAFIAMGAIFYGNLANKPASIADVARLGPVPNDVKAYPSTAISIDKDGLVAQFAPRNVDFQHALRDAEYYVSRPDHRAIATSKDAYFMRTARPSLGDAEDLALEGCQIWAKMACSLLATEARWTSGDERGTLHAMPRVSYQGLFDPAMIPIINDTVRNRADVTGYRSAVGPKAAALLPSFGLFFVARASSQYSAEESALSQCNSDPARNNMSGPCFLYAVDDQVILAKGLTQPMAAR